MPGHGATLGLDAVLSYVAVKAEGAVTYANNYLPYFLKPDGSGVLTVTGFFVCAMLMGVLALVNLLAVRKLPRINSAITWWKIAVPLLTVVVLIVASTHWNVWTADGIVFSFLGFRTAIDLGSESANPGRNIPIAVIGSVVLATIAYVLL